MEPVLRSLLWFQVRCLMGNSYTRKDTSECDLKQSPTSCEHGPRSKLTESECDKNIIYLIRCCCGLEPTAFSHIWRSSQALQVRWSLLSGYEHVLLHEICPACFTENVKEIYKIEEFIGLSILDESSLEEFVNIIANKTIPRVVEAPEEMDILVSGIFNSSKIW